MNKILKALVICALIGVGGQIAWRFYIASIKSHYQQHLPDRTVLVGADQRAYYIYVPQKSTDRSRDILVFFQGGDANSDGAWLIPQQKRWTELADEKGIIIAIPQGRVFADNEGAWQLNTDSSTMQDIRYIRAMLDDISATQKLATVSVYGVGYSLGSMFAYEVACHMSDRFDAIASFAGTMPVNPKICNPEHNIRIMHIHGTDDPIIQYNETWDWKAWDSVGTMRDIPSLIEYWSEKFNCRERMERKSASTFQIRHSICDQGSAVEHYSLEGWDHDWPENIEGISTHLLMWNFLDQSQ